jgi:hypothetical protein
MVEMSVVAPFLPSFSTLSTKKENNIRSPNTCYSTMHRHTGAMHPLNTILKYFHFMFQRDRAIT